MTELMNLYHKLALQSEIPDMNEYADQWNLLAAEFKAQERPAMAENCYSRFRQYSQLSKYMPSVRRVREGDVTYLRQMKQAVPTLAGAGTERQRKAADRARFDV